MYEPLSHLSYYISPTAIKLPFSCGLQSSIVYISALYITFPVFPFEKANSKLLMTNLQNIFVFKIFLGAFSPLMDRTDKCERGREREGVTCSKGPQAGVEPENSGNSLVHGAPALH